MSGNTRDLASQNDDQQVMTRSACSRFGYKSVALLPIRLEHSVIGLIHLADWRENAIPMQNLEILETASMELGTAVQRVRTREAIVKARDGLERRVRERTLELALANEKLLLEIEERKKAEEATRKSAENLKRFAYSVMHDLKSPAIGIYGISRVLQRKYGEVVGENGQSYCDQIAKASEHLTLLVQKINHFIISKEAPLEIEQVNLNKVLRIIKEEFSSRVSVRQIEWFEPSISVEICADQLSLIRALRNLVDNALKYGAQNLSRIDIGYDSNEQFHILAVADNGIGIKPEDREKIFGLFERNASPKGIEGAGLGLNIVREVAHRHGGEIRVSSEPGEGTIFFISIAKDPIAPKSSSWSRQP